MALGRPQSKDSPEKYRESFEMYRLTQPRLPAKSTMAREIGAFLEWAISLAQPGFAVGEIINIGALATGLGRSRNTAAKGVELLVAKGMVARGKLKSPYQIVSTWPIFRDSQLVADEQISLTLKMDSESMFSPVHSLQLDDDHDEYVSFLARELRQSRDTLIHEAAGKNWLQGPGQMYLRLRTHDRRKSPGEQPRIQGFLAEVTFLNLDPDQAMSFAEIFGRVQQQRVPQVSMYPLLEQCGLSNLRAGRTQVSLGSPPGFVVRELTEALKGRDVDFAAFDTSEPLLKWTYALFHPAVQPMVTFSVCYVLVDLLSIFIRKLDVEVA